MLSLSAHSLRFWIVYQHKTPYCLSALFLRLVVNVQKKFFGRFGRLGRLDSPKKTSVEAWKKSKPSKSRPNWASIHGLTKSSKLQKNCPKRPKNCRGKWDLIGGLLSRQRLDRIPWTFGRLDRHFRDKDLGYEKLSKASKDSKTPANVCEGQMEPPFTVYQKV